MKNVFPTQLSNRPLELAVLRLARCERDTIVELMAHLAEFDRRRLYREAGYSSLFVYCTGPLKLTEHEAYNRMKAARAVRRFPQILDLLADGSLNLTTVRLLAPHLTPATLDEVLKAACGKSKREVEELVARLAPQPDVPTRIRALPERGNPAVPPAASDVARDSAGEQTVPLLHPVETAIAAAAAGPVSAGPPPATTAPPPHRPPITPLSPQRYQITFTASTETRDKLEHARDLLRHAIPTGDVSAIMDRALTVLIDALPKKKFAMTDDGGRCTFVSKNGHRCNERAFVERDHTISRAAGGPTSARNLRLLCKAHNLYEAEKYFGTRASEGEVRESAVPYGASVVNNTRPGTSCVPNAQLSASSSWTSLAPALAARSGSREPARTSTRATTPGGRRTRQCRVHHRTGREDDGHRSECRRGS